MNFNDLPKRFSRMRLHRSDLSDHPSKQLLRWLEEARETVEFNAMTLATATKDGKPSCRIVLLKQVDEKGLVFFTNYASRKARELDANPFAMANFYWDELMRQVNIEGHVEKISREESEDYFSKRPRGSQIAAWASSQGEVIASSEELKKRFEDLEIKFQGEEIPLPPFWGGYRILPFRYEFWNGGKDRLHDRFQYLLIEDQWRIERLAP